MAAMVPILSLGGINMARWINNLLDLVSNQLVIDEVSSPDASAPDILDSVEHARKDWLTARVYFDNVTDPDLIDHAIYRIEAAEKKYIYLLKQAKSLGVRFNLPLHEQHLIMEAKSHHH